MFTILWDFKKLEFSKVYFKARGSQTQGYKKAIVSKGRDTTGQKWDWRGSQFPPVIEVVLK